MTMIGRKRRSTAILTDTPEKEALEMEKNVVLLKKAKKRIGEKKVPKKAGKKSKKSKKIKREPESDEEEEDVCIVCLGELFKIKGSLVTVLEL